MPSRILDEIRALDPLKDHQRIVFLCTSYEFAFDITRALEFALFRTYAVPSIAALLDRTAEFYQRPQKRYDDTDLIVSEMMNWGYESERGKAALRRMNQQHARFAIPNADLLYVLSTFIYEPIRWVARFGYRPMCLYEQLAMFYFWREVGRRMNIQDLPDDYDTFERYNREYERKQFRFTEASRRVGMATRELFAGWFPALLRPLVRRAIHALLEDSLIAAFGFPPPSRAMRGLVLAALKLRAGVLRWLPGRKRPYLRSEEPHRSYPHGHRIEDLGPQAEALGGTDGNGVRWDPAQAAPLAQPPTSTEK
jgi:hypothetical protein